MMDGIILQELKLEGLNNNILFYLNPNYKYFYSKNELKRVLLKLNNNKKTKLLKQNINDKNSIT